MNLWKYYDGDLKYPDLNNHLHEKEIAKTNPKWAYEYTSEHGKDKELEPIIAKNAKYSYMYADKVLRYADKVLRDEFKLGEKAIAKDIKYSFWYAKYILKDKFPLGEPAIAKDSYYSYLYALDVLEGPFKLGEPEIAKDEYYSKEYTQNVLKKDFYLDGKLICKYEE
jgi:hypothetical protein